MKLQKLIEIKLHDAVEEYFILKHLQIKINYVTFLIKNLSYLKTRSLCKHLLHYRKTKYILISCYQADN